MQRMILGSEADRVTIPVSPPDHLDIVWVVELRPQGRTVAYAPPHLPGKRVEEGRDRDPGMLHPKRRIAAGGDAAARIEHVLAQGDVLTGYVGLVLAAAIVASDNAAIGGRALRPVDPTLLECELFGRMIAGRQLGDERRDSPRIRIDGHDP